MRESDATPCDGDIAEPLLHEVGGDVSRPGPGLPMRRLPRRRRPHPAPAEIPAQAAPSTQAARRGVVDALTGGIAVGCIALIVVLIVAYKAALLGAIPAAPFFTIYGLVVVTYILSRFAISLAYRPCADRGAEPSVAIVMPAFNEAGVIASAIDSLLRLDYPPAKLELVVVNDGSSDATGAEIDRVALAEPRVRVLHFAENRGKRAAMAAGIRATQAEVVAFVDSDSLLEPDALRMLVQDFADPRVGAVAGHADVLNRRESLLARMQAVRYFVAFRVVKAAESVFGAVTCCSGCFSAYRRSAIMPHLGRWEHQRFLGRAATFGDDRALTNVVLRHWKVRYQSAAVSRTIVPATYGRFLRQQLRWKRSWTRESLIVCGIIWRKHPLAAVATYVGIVLPVLSPLVALRAMLWRPLAEGTEPVVYLLGMYAIALVYGLYYEARTRRADGLWLCGVAFVFLYLAVLVWQTYWAMLTARNNDWGTRGAGASASGPAATSQPAHAGE
jgi:hyaluronan synthase